MPDLSFISCLIMKLAMIIRNGRVIFVLRGKNKKELKNINKIGYAVVDELAPIGIGLIWLGLKRGLGYSLTDISNIIT